MNTAGLARDGAGCLVAAVLAAGAPSSAGAQVPSNATGMPVSRLEGADAPVLRQAPPARPPADQLPPLPVTQLEERDRASLDGPRTVSLTFSQPLPVTDVLMLLVRGTPFSVVTEASVTGTFIGELKDLTMRQALEAVLFPQALDYAVDGTVIRVYPRRPETRLFEVDYLNVRRSLQRRVQADAAVGAPAAGTELSTRVDSDVFAGVDAGVRALLSASGRHHVDGNAGLVQVTDFADRLDRVSAYLEAVHVRVNRQVRLDARVFEVTLTEAAGIDWAAVAARAGARLHVAAPGVAAAGIRAGDVDVLVNAIGEQGTVRMIAAPRIVAMNNEPAVMRAGTSEVYFTRGTARLGRDEEVEARPMTVAAGLTLTVTPHVAADGIVQLNVAPTWAEKAGQVKSPAGDAVPVLRVSEADTLVRVQEGEMVVISGLLQERTEARTSPGFAGFFGAQERRTVRVELVVLLSAALVVPGVFGAEGLQ